MKHLRQHEKVVANQGDQIGQIFDSLAIVIFGQFFEK
jgi:hypothetical protein